MRPMVTVALALAGSACGQRTAPALPSEQRADLAVRTARVLDVRTGRYSGPSVVLVTGTRIVGVQPAPAFDPRSATRVIDLGDLTVVPGFIDAHVHLAIGGPVRSNALADLRAGFTTVADQGALTHRLLALKDSINAGHIEGPRVLAAGIWVGAKGGVCEFTGIGIAGGVDGFVDRVRQNVAAGANLTKVCLSSWPQASYAVPDSAEIPPGVLRAIVESSHAAGRPVTAHAISRGSAVAALDAGVDGLVHAAFVDASIASAMRARGMWMSPTIASLTANDTTAVARALASAVRVANDAGVMLVFGTDGGVLPHGRGADEMAALVAVGLSPLQVIQSATVNAARALTIADTLGQIAAGMSADLVAIPGDPLRDVRLLGDVRFVLSRGRVAVEPR